MENLIIAPIGKESIHQQWFCDHNRNFDFIALCYEPVPSSFICDAIDRIERKAYKFANVKEYWNNNTLKIDHYDYIFMPDDDIEMTTADINLLFEIARGFSLDLCQPSLTTDSFYSWPVTLWCGKEKCILRTTNFVEIMCPLFSRKAFGICLETFGQNSVGMGIDFVWPKLLHFQNIAIIDAVQARHGRPLRKWSEQFDAEKEWEKIRTLYNVELFQHVVYRYALKP